MSVGVLIITHGEIGRALLDSAVQILGVCPLDTRCLSAPNDEDPDLVLDRALELTDGLDQGDGILVLTDGSGYEIEALDLDVPVPEAPVWVVHLDGAYPLGYDDATLAAIQASGSPSSRSRATRRSG